MQLQVAERYKQIVDDIANLAWEGLTRDDMIAVAWGYYFFSVQFRESLELAREQHPWDERLRELHEGECDTDNLSPCLGVADAGERMNHDEFMRRVLLISGFPQAARTQVEATGHAYLTATRRMPEVARALSIASYEDGGLEAVFRAMLLAPDWSHPSLQAFRHFLVLHIAFDSDENGGHGALSRHLVPDDRVLPLWTAFRTLLVSVAPALLRPGQTAFV
jgi:hypothetical protein